MTFDDFCNQFTLTPEERNALVRYLAILRYERTLKLLREGGL
jgi:hypothetical protein